MSARQTTPAGIAETASPETAAPAIADLLHAHRFAVLDEHQLQADLATVLDRGGVAHEREVRLGPRDRVDFLTSDGVGIEVKVAGAAAAVLAQLTRYSRSGQVRSLLLVTTRTAHAVLPREVGGVALGVVLLRGAG